MDYRWAAYQAARAEIVKNEGSLEAFAKGYERLGFTREAGATVYREWAPAAQAAALIGDFNGWQPAWMTKDEFGVWELRLPDGAPARHARLKREGQQRDGRRQQKEQREETAAAGWGDERQATNTTTLSQHPPSPSLHCFRPRRHARDRARQPRQGAPAVVPGLVGRPRASVDPLRDGAAG